MKTIYVMQGNGIAKQILREAVKIFKVFELPSTDKKQTYYLNDVGLNWINHCFDIGILTEPPFKRP